MKVRATRLGYYNHIRRREGDVFELEPTTRIKGYDDPIKRDQVRLHPELNWERETITVEMQFSPLWMEKVDDATPTSVTASPQALKKHHDETLAGRAPKRAA